MHRRRVHSLLLGASVLPVAGACFGVLAGCSAAGAGGHDDLPQIRARGVLKIGTSGAAPPNTWVNAKNELTGYDIDWGRLVADHLQLPLRWVKVDFRGLMPALSSGQLDMVITGVRIRESLQRVFLFSEPYAYERMVAVVRHDDTAFTSLADLRGRSIGVVAASFQEDTVRRIGGWRELLPMPSGSDVFLSLHTGHIDTAVVGYTAAVHFERRHPGTVRIVREGGGVNAQGIVMQKGAQALKAEVDRVVAAARADGRYLALYRRNFGIEPPQ